MPFSFDRRAALRALAASAAAGLARTEAQAAAPAPQSLSFGDPLPFSFERLKEEARARATAPFVSTTTPAPEVLAKIDYDAWGKIRYRTDAAVFANGPGRFPVTFFHLGKFFQTPVDMYVVENGLARPIVYDPGLFDMPADSPARQLPKGSGFAGLRYQEARGGALDWRKNDWVAFLGASYFRAIGELHQYGLSARGVALNVAVAGKDEEFPAFTRFYIGDEKGESAILYALLEGPSIVGAYRFSLTRDKAVTMDVEQSLFLRADIARFGIAPCTSMYWFSETVKPTAIDWRPEVHDSDGLAMWTGKGERVWRPLNNPARATASAFIDENPKGFGLLQRDRVFDHYLDGVFYDRRPSLWVEPIGAWGRGAVELVELPTDDEIHDNIVAMWTPEAPAKAGGEWTFRYKLHWRANEPYSGPLAKCVATRLGRGGQPGQPRPPGLRKFLVEFLGGPLASLAFGVAPQAVVSTSRGEFGPYRLTEAVPDGVAGHWRTQFDLQVEGPDPVELRCYLKLGERALTETWAFQYHPF
ncbi:MAG TPA: glucan biosynthesis protein D [Beijerinckiaceae bacterium]|nr:glucan biosynthesis protein D [Beijerinckiaceae bacterium]